MFKRFVFVLVMVVLLGGVSGCAAQSAAALPQTAPEEIVEAFYAWYLGDRASGPKNLAESEFISEIYIKAMEEAGPGGGANMICAQDFPDEVRVEDVQIEGDQANVVVKTSFGSEIRIDLNVENGQWMIVGSTCLP